MLGCLGEGQEGIRRVSVAHLDVFIRQEVGFAIRGQLKIINSATRRL